MEIISLNGKWKCKPDLENLGIKNKWCIPHDYDNLSIFIFFFTRLIYFFMEYIEKKPDYINRY